MLDLENAQLMANRALARARELGIKVSVSIVDRSGRLVLTLRDDGAGFFTTDTSQAKAVAAAAFGKPTSELVKMRDANPFWTEVTGVLQGQALPTTGGVPIVSGTDVIGAIGIGGGAPDQDEDIASTALQVLEKAA